jgi:hypothetical protein
MTDHIDFDNVARAWLREGPDRLADRVLDDALEQIHGTSQRARLGVLWRFPQMSPIARMATALAMVALVAVAGAFVAQRTSNVATAPSASPTSTPAPSIPLTPYTSDRFHYSIGHPVSWTVEPATTDASEDPFGHGVDRFTIDGATDTWVLVSSDPLRPGEKPLERQGSIDQTNAMSCLYTKLATTFTLDGVDARREELHCFQRDNILEVFVVHADRSYFVQLFGKGVPLRDRDRAIFEQMLTSFRFLP